ncbi:HD domain-containing phosphohydrolase [Pseudomonas aeruginosa]|nr:HD domain-containing phosphohydrolase [Pseudomonas aeruginosa]
MKQHPEAGARLLRLGGAAPQVHDVALLHHEKVDGSGYPQGLVGENIPLLARMGAICDVYDAVTSERPYKKAWEPAIAIRHTPYAIRHTPDGYVGRTLR